MKTPEIAFRIRKLREYRNYTQSYMAFRLDVKQNTYSLIERGAYELKPARLELIAAILEIDITLLLSDNFELYKTAGSDKSQQPDSSIMQQMERVIKTLEDEVKYLRDQNHHLLAALKYTNTSPNGIGLGSAY